MRAGLIGKRLGHSFSKQIHEQLANYTYELIPLTEEEMREFMCRKEFDAINVTIPYKEKVMEYCDEIDGRAKAIGAVNAIVNRGGKLYATNTDFMGLKYMIERRGIQIRDKICCILGTGGTSRTAEAVLRSMGAKEVVKAGRNHAEGVIPYEELKRITEIQVFVNATSVGMYPNCEEQLIDLADYPKVEAVADVIYNPLQTKLCRQAQRLGVKWVCGLQMLVAQAKFAVEFFLNTKISDEAIGQLTKKIKADMMNVVLIGMPSSGKTTIGKRAAEILGKAFVDLDGEIEKETGLEIREIFARYGEESFRKTEEAVAKKFAAEHGQVISCGGGIIKREENMERLRQNGVVFHLTRDVEKLLVDEKRPLSSSREKLLQMEKERTPLYEAYRDAVIQNDGTPEEAAEKIREGFDEILSY